jgi:FKBP-type peptidyl-prolyl cis-trans isomerase FkpA
MRKIIIGIFILLLAVPTWAAQPKTEEQKTLYALGVIITKQLSVFDLTAEEYDFVKMGINDAAAGKKLVVLPEDYGKNINTLAQDRAKTATQKQKELAKPYLENAAKEKDAEKTASGLIYKPIIIGTGAQPTASDVVKVHYTGTLIDGKEFDSSVKRGQPIEFPLGQVIPCWTEGVAKMKVGGKAMLICPSEIAYGDQGRAPIIPGGATLIFEVELLDVQKQPAPAPPAAKKQTKAKSKK